MGPDRNYCPHCGREDAFDDPRVSEVSEMLARLGLPTFARDVALAQASREALGRARWQHDEEARRIGVYGEGDGWDPDCPF